MTVDKQRSTQKRKLRGKLDETSVPTADQSLSPTASIGSLNASDLTKMISAEVNRAVANLGGGRTGVHVNSGPPGFVNGGGHANFDPKVALGLRGGIDPRVASGAHVNSGPPGFVNGGGHANFDPKVDLGFDQVTLPDGSRVHIPSVGPVNIMVRGFKITRQ